MTATVASQTDLLKHALSAIADRGYWSAFPESPSPRIYGEDAASTGAAAFQAYLGKDFPLDQPSDSFVSTESSPFGIALDVRYPHAPVDDLVSRATAARSSWQD